MRCRATTPFSSTNSSTIAPRSAGNWIALVSVDDKFQKACLGPITGDVGKFCLHLCKKIELKRALLGLKTKLGISEWRSCSRRSARPISSRIPSPPRWRCRRETRGQIHVASNNARQRPAASSKANITPPGPPPTIQQVSARLVHDMRPAQHGQFPLSDSARCIAHLPVCILIN